MEAGVSRHFTVDEADELLPTLRPVLEDLQRLHRQMVSIAEEVAEFERLAGQDGHGANKKIFAPGHDMGEVQREVQQRLLYLRGVGIELKDIENGIVDFPTRMFGRDVYLCWHLDEDHVAYWHDVDAGFAGRQPL